MVSLDMFDAHAFGAVLDYMYGKELLFSIEVLFHHYYYFLNRLRYHKLICDLLLYDTDCGAYVESYSAFGTKGVRAGVLEALDVNRR